jgi:hypothetical protein
MLTASWPALPRLLIVSAAGAIGYLGALWLFERETMMTVVNTIGISKLKRSSSALNNDDRKRVEFMSQHQLVFVCGLHRSGTSVLFRSLRGHPLMSGFEDTNSPENEGMHLQTVYQPSGHYGGAGKFGFSPEAHLTEASELVSDANRKKLFEEWKPYWDLDKPFRRATQPDTHAFFAGHVSRFSFCDFNAPSDSGFASDSCLVSPPPLQPPPVGSLD